MPTFVNCLAFAILAACLSSGKLFTKRDREWRGQSTFHAAHGFFTLKIRSLKYLIRTICNLFRTVTNKNANFCSLTEVLKSFRV